MTTINRRILIAAAGTAMAAPALAQGRPTLKIGLGPQQPTQADTRRVWEPVYKAVAEKVGANLELQVANDWAGIATALANEQIDVAQMGPWGYILAKVRGEARIINTMLVNGIPTYKAIIVARPGLTVAKFPEDARGKSMQMLDVGSTSGWLVPTHFLRSKGIDPKTFFGRYAEGASAAAAQMATINGQVDLATGWDTHRNTMIRNGTIQPTSNTVVWESEPLPNECVVVSKSFPQARAEALGAALAGLSDEEKKLLPWPYTGFVPATHQPYEGLEKMGRDLGAIRTS
ncbi:phosphate/phosphite/phosphonate ABC transporter substrate-binding protein [Phreatobacter oligotrophus]|jgi:phosphonate transport system substrate-binding protein|uniref:phosphate/phosphite/phosphonate ABC transporter substrate-binding protein n=1 Tax=Phreatobacter oligotrophus TaxID=1122261 RepID=UPI002356A797|nr:phosphate/phosphite/phosphonate ABC transporter substrate-binding protein [Phreatobacter oligotrophus]MBX9989559.1 phosphate/phosphite/phosphonate ABC transporter substrate-binding protein [Phreatobacter oligotrophus]